MTNPFSGVIPILPTPFTSKGEIDDDGFANVIDAAISARVDGLAMFGLASEYYKLSDAERLHLTKLLVRKAANRCPVIISIVPHATRLAVEEARRAVDAGADALMILPPFFVSPSMNAVLRHIHDVATAVSVPVIVQYAPIQTGLTIDAQAFAELHQRIPHFRSIKVDSVPSGPMISALHACGLESLVGYMGLHLPEDFSRGVGGVMPTVSLSPIFVKIWSLLRQDQLLARDMHAKFLPLITFMMQSIELLIVSEKELLTRRGIIDSAYCREPTYALDPVQKHELETYANQLTSWLTQH